MIELHQRADEAWDRAWDLERDTDAKFGRVYDRRRYARAAHAARVLVLGACDQKTCNECPAKGAP